MDVKSYFSLTRQPPHRLEVQCFEEVIVFEVEQLQIFFDENGMNEESIIFRLSFYPVVIFFQKVSAPAIDLPQKAKAIEIS